MSELRLEHLEMPGAELGPCNPFPDLLESAPVPFPDNWGGNVTPEQTRYFGYGLVQGCLPYRVLDQYTRDRRPRKFRVAVLENETLRATVLLEFGGRLWSLYHKPAQRELLHRNPVFQPANLAIRNAWFSGGVEWNCGMIGHSPFTCSPLFAARLRLDDGAPVLRLYEWDRIRCVPFQIDLFLPDRSASLFVRVRIVNPHDHEVPMYWWSNIAVDETPGTRVLVPAQSAFTSGFGNQNGNVSIPVTNGVDVSYPVNVADACDFFYTVPDGQRPWEAALDAEGRGLIHASTDRLKGRKLFVWGMNPGGRRWQEFLSERGSAYVEIQGGICRTQMECMPMPAGAEWSWLESYSLMRADPRLAHGPDWRAAWGEARKRLDRDVPLDTLESMLKDTAAMADRTPSEIIQRGAGWGALENKRRRADGLKPFCSQALVFDDQTLGPDQVPWLQLLEEGALPEADPDGPPGGWMVQPEWRERLEKSVRQGQGRGDHWFSHLHLGVMRYYADDFDGARQAWRESLNKRVSVCALRNLAVHAKRSGDAARAAELLSEAWRHAPGGAPLLVELCRALVDAGQTDKLLALLPQLTEEQRGMGRVRLAEAFAWNQKGEYERARDILTSGIELAVVREGEVLLSELWFSIQERLISAREGIPINDALKARARRECPPPREIDFRLKS